MGILKAINRIIRMPGKAKPRTPIRMGRESVIQYLNHLSENKGVGTIHEETERRIRGGEYLIGEDNLLRYLGYETNLPDGYHLVRDQGFFYIDYVANGRAIQTKVVDDEEAALMIQHLSQSSWLDSPNQNFTTKFNNQ